MNISLHLAVFLLLVSTVATTKATNLKVKTRCEDGQHHYKCGITELMTDTCTEYMDPCKNGENTGRYYLLKASKNHSTPYFYDFTLYPNSTCKPPFVEYINVICDSCHPESILDPVFYVSCPESNFIFILGLSAGAGCILLLSCVSLVAFVIRKKNKDKEKQEKLLLKNNSVYKIPMYVL